MSESFIKPYNGKNYIGIMVEGTLEIFEANSIDEVKEITKQHFDLDPRLFKVDYTPQEITDLDIKNYLQNGFVYRLNQY